MTTPTLSLADALAVVADAAARDPALRTMVASRLGLTDPKARDFGPAPVGLPDLSALTALQVSLFDNGPKPIAAVIEYWTEDGFAQPRKNGHRKMTAIKLYPQKRFLSNLKKMRSDSIAPEWIETMRAIAQAGPDHLYGPIFVSKPGHGSGYIEGQILIAEIDGGMVRDVQIVAHPQKLVATLFTRSSHNDRPLAPNLIGSARVSLRGDGHVEWATEVGNIVGG